ncbi:sigma-70 family RNA polymerase sigma factor [Lederbergia sp. NSJ-179]|uniref:sigma-70 family RNA polymerase sigma factor n=1 Tax=Lederbergia sp. NSJ-179 TaxID=2931402 RepID=UPI001FCFBCA2|nr:sigma-70 family RNA polymerase sigma factor [Lederbergia sp. NSJ-179]MCJ7843375.1 sigma-70 family RNA polymerase sigma factor [Lederbergia sp. NSJ-179]
MESFDEMVENYQPMIYHVMKSLSIYKNQDEFFQTGLIAFWDAYQRFDHEKGEFSSYAYSYIKGRMMTKLTKDKQIEERNVYPDEAFWENTVEEEEQWLEQEHLQNYCVGLSDKQKQWVIDTFYKGMTTRDIAEKEKLSLSAIKKRKSVTLAKIRENIERGVVEV